MKNASQIITTLQHKPQFSKLLETACINKLKSALLPSIQHNIKHGYIKNSTLYFVLTTRLNKLDIDNIINTIKMILKSPMIKSADRFIECADVEIEDVKIYTDNKPQKNIKTFSTSSHLVTYKERSTGEVKINFEDDNLQELASRIMEIIKSKK